MTALSESSEHDALFSRFADGVQTPGDEQALAALLANDPAARRRFRRVMSLHSSLHWAYASVASQAAVEPANGRTSSSPRRSIAGFPFRPAAAVMLTALAVAAIATVAGWLTRAPQPIVAVAPTVKPLPLATVMQTRFVETTANGSPLLVGDPVPESTLKILGGAVAIRLSSGVEMLLEGPGELELADAMRAVLRSGAVVVKMPEGMQGFRLETATADVLDLGTEFAVKIGPDMRTDVQVYDGAVIAATRSPAAGGLGFPRRLAAGEAARFAAGDSADAVDLPFDAGRFVRRLPPDRGIEHRAPSQPTNEAAARELIRQFGRPEHAGIQIHRATGPITIDGNLDEWADAPGFTAWLNGDRAAAESVDGRMMYDADCLYIAAHVGDPAPLASRVNPVTDPDDGWRGGALQIRLSTDRSLGWPVNANAPNYYRMRQLEPDAADRQASVNPRLSHLTLWYHAPSQTPCLTIRHGMMTGEMAVNPSGYSGSYAATADGRGYTVEFAIPWRLLNSEADPPQPGDVLGVAWQVLFSDDGGRLWRTQIIDVRNPDEPPRIYTWERAATWGRAEYR